MTKDIYGMLRKPPFERTTHDLDAIAVGIRGVSFFDRLDSQIRLQCCRALRYEFCKAEKTIFNEGDAGSLFYVILEGSVGIFVPYVGVEASSQHDRKRKCADDREVRRRAWEAKKANSRLSLAIDLGLVSERQRGRSSFSMPKAPVLSEDSEGFSSGDGEEDEENSDSNDDRPEFTAMKASKGPAPTNSNRKHVCFDEPIKKSPAKHIATLRCGEAFGEVALESCRPRTATVRALEPTHLATLDRFQYQKILATSLDCKEKRNVLSQIPLFNSWTECDLKYLTKMLHRRELKKNELVYDIGSPVLQVFLIQNGTFALHRKFITKRTIMQTESHQVEDLPISFATNDGGVDMSHGCALGQPLMPVDSFNVVDERAGAFSRRRSTKVIMTTSLLSNDSDSSVPERRASRFTIETDSRHKVGNSAENGASRRRRRSMHTLMRRLSSDGPNQRRSRRGSAFTMDLDTCKKTSVEVPDSPSRTTGFSNDSESLESALSQRVSPISITKESGRSKSHDSNWCTVSVLGEQHILGLSDYLQGLSAHSERVVCESSSGSLYAFLARTLCSMMSVGMRKKVIQGAQARDEFLEKRLSVLQHIAMHTSDTGTGPSAPREASSEKNRPCTSPSSTLECNHCKSSHSLPAQSNMGSLMICPRPQLRQKLRSNCPIEARMRVICEANERLRADEKSNGNQFLHRKQETTFHSIHLSTRVEEQFCGNIKTSDAHKRPFNDNKISNKTRAAVLCRLDDMIARRKDGVRISQTAANADVQSQSVTVALEAAGPQLEPLLRKVKIMKHVGFPRRPPTCEYLGSSMDALGKQERAIIKRDTVGQDVLPETSSDPLEDCIEQTLSATLLTDTEDHTSFSKRRPGGKRGIADHLPCLLGHERREESFADCSPCNLTSDTAQPCFAPADHGLGAAKFAALDGVFPVEFSAGLSQLRSRSSTFKYSRLENAATCEGLSAIDPSSIYVNRCR